MVIKISLHGKVMFGQRLERGAGAALAPPPRWGKSCAGLPRTRGAVPVGVPGTAGTSAAAAAAERAGVRLQGLTSPCVLV